MIHMENFNEAYVQYDGALLPYATAVSTWTKRSKTDVIRRGASIELDYLISQ